MKIITIVFSILVVIAYVQCEENDDDDEDDDDQYAEIKWQCYDEAEVSEKLRRLNNTKDPELKCFHACVYTKIGMMNNGKLIEAKFLEKVKEILDEMSDDDKNSFTKQLHSCIDKANAEHNPCERAYSMVNCL